MTRDEFLSTLKSAVSSMPYSEVEKALSYYSESIEDHMEDGMSEEEAVAHMGDMGSIIKSIEEDFSIGSLVKNKIIDSKNKSKNIVLWMILLICGSPLWVPLTMGVVLTVLVLYFMIWAILASIYAAEAVLALSGVLGIVMGIIYCFIKAPVTGFMIIGVAIACIGIAIICFMPIGFISKKLLHLTVFSWRKIKGLFATKEAA